MNQSIIFADAISIDGKKQQLMLVAHQQGMRIECVLPFERLSALSGEEVTVTNAAALLETVRFEVEEMAESLIEEDAFDEWGRIEL
ncbi:DUF1488 domain-containing protein [Shewanella litorisediminis]|uniref:DUF1488 domain-containing protein n=1 Tax=Shewanella litorisediminis TaxID=1173586 RepID=A0ABX7G3M2_9GAMM|nr:DUF1488 domain-containing protein [Shewanella litorisediminis]MCL2920184.1 DUF1488 domain-containing protein [Shewanella litorisediminis]QRH01911.1 DUF1488 domain-containing protein [Shewanella litorisediminis]